MALQLPTKFALDLQGETALAPVVVIGNNTTDITENIIISTESLSRLPSGFPYVLEGYPVQEITAKPILLNMPSLKESIDIEKRNYKISSINLDISNFPYEGKIFSELVSGSLINTECRIFWASPQADEIDALDPGTSDMMQVYFGSIRKYTHDDEKVRLVIEDKSQSVLHKTLPDISLEGDMIHDKYKNKPIPIVHGKVDKSPCVIDTSGGFPAIKADSKVLGSSSGLYVNRDEVFLSVPKFIQYDFDSHDDLEGAGNITQQWNLVNSDYELQNTILFQNQLLQVQYIGVPHNMAIRIHEGGTQYEVSPDPESGNILSSEDVKRITDIDTTYNSPEMNIVSSGTANVAGQFYTAGTVPPFSMGCTYFEVSNGIDVGSENDIMAGLTVNGYALPGFFNNPNEFAALKGAGITLYKDQNAYGTPQEEAAYGGIAATYYDIEDGRFSNMDSLFYFDHYQDGDTQGTFGSVDAAFRNLGWNTGTTTSDKFSKFVLHIAEGLYRVYIGFSHKSIQAVGTELVSVSSESYKLSSIEVNTIHDIKNPLKDKYYIDVEGRIDSMGFPESAPKIINHLLVNELGQEAVDIPSEYGGWDYAFSVDKYINSKKLIEEIASASPFLPRFNSAGEFKYNVIKEEYNATDLTDTPGEAGGDKIPNTTINNAEVIDFSFSRTPIEDVYTKIVFKYNWNYAVEDFTNSVESDTDIIPCYDPAYYGFPTEPEKMHSKSTLVIEDSRGKYIRTKETARLYADWFLLWSANQHLKMKVKLPLKYMNLEIGDIVEFNETLGGVKPYRINYIKLAGQDTSDVVGSQAVYPYFMIIATNKTINFCEIECVQMHKLVQEANDECAIPGCTDQDACNYDPLANATVDNGSCDYGTICCDSTFVNTHQECDPANCPEPGGVECPDDWYCPVRDCHGQCSVDSSGNPNPDYIGNTNGLDAGGWDECGVCGGPHVGWDGVTFSNTHCNCEGGMVYDCAGECVGNAVEHCIDYETPDSTVEQFCCGCNGPIPRICYTGEFGPFPYCDDDECPETAVNRSRIDKLEFWHHSYTGGPDIAYKFWRGYSTEFNLVGGIYAEELITNAQRPTGAQPWNYYGFDPPEPFAMSTARMYFLDVMNIHFFNPLCISHDQKITNFRINIELGQYVDGNWERRQDGNGVWQNADGTLGDVAIAQKDTINQPWFNTHLNEWQDVTSDGSGMSGDFEWAESEWENVAGNDCYPQYKLIDTLTSGNMPFKLDSLALYVKPDYYWQNSHFPENAGEEYVMNPPRVDGINYVIRFRIDWTDTVHTDEDSGFVFTEYKYWEVKMDGCGVEIGDINGDGYHDITDVLKLANCVAGGYCADLGDTNHEPYYPGFACAADVSGDNNYTVLDVVQLANCVFCESCPDDCPDDWEWE
ncbi:hypothetical protein CL634_08245 [bacterium]|nr:hypothetical protein [bacterium]